MRFKKSAKCFGPAGGRAVRRQTRWSGKFATRLGVRHAIAVANGTAALQTLPLFPARTYEQARLVSDCFHDAIENANVGD